MRKILFISFQGMVVFSFLSFVCVLSRPAWGMASCKEAVECAQKGQGKVLICHLPPGNPANAQNICIDDSGATAHLTQHNGDTKGCCPDAFGAKAPEAKKLEAEVGKKGGQAIDYTPDGMKKWNAKFYELNHGYSASMGKKAWDYAMETMDGEELKNHFKAKMEEMGVDGKESISFHTGLIATMAGYKKTGKKMSSGKMIEDVQKLYGESKEAYSSGMTYKTLKEAITYAGGEEAIKKFDEGLSIVSNELYKNPDTYKANLDTVVPMYVELPVAGYVAGEVEGMVDVEQKGAQQNTSTGNPQRKMVLCRFGDTYRSPEGQNSVLRPDAVDCSTNNPCNSFETCVPVD